MKFKIFNIMLFKESSHVKFQNFQGILVHNLKFSLNTDEKVTFYTLKKNI